MRSLKSFSMVVFIQGLKRKKQKPGHLEIKHSIVFIDKVTFG